jgi:hypothetical protein
VFAIVVAAVLAVAIIPRYERDTLYEMAEQVLGHIQYTQHMAMMDNVYQEEEENWYKARWHLRFVNGSCGLFYRVGSDRDMDGNGVIEASEAARDPLTHELIYNTTLVCEDHAGWYNDVLLGLKYHVLSVESSCNTQTIAFDQLGRPYTGVAGDAPTDKLMEDDCEYTFTHSDGNQVKITVTAETGYAYITYI